MITWNETQSVLRAVLRWWWVILLAVAMSAGTAFYSTQNEQRFYLAHTTLMIGNAFQRQVPDPNQLSIGSTLAHFYAELARRERVLLAVQHDLQLPLAWQEIRDGMLATATVPNANLLEIYVTDSNPERAAAIANAIAQHLIDYSPASAEDVRAEQAVVQQQIEDVNSNIEFIKQEIAEYTAQLRTATSASDRAEINQSLAELNTTLTAEQNAYAALLTMKNNSVVNSLSVFEAAEAPTYPLPSKRSVVVASAGGAGLLLALLAIFLLEKIDPRWRTPRDLQERLNLNSLGRVPLGPTLRNATGFDAAQRAQAVREVQSNILLALAERGVRSLLVTGPYASQERTNLTIDLADVFARSGQKVLLVDADTTQALLTQALAEAASDTCALVSCADQPSLWAQLQPTALANVALLPGRAAADGAPTMLASTRWQQIVAHLRDAADIVIFDGPAILSGPDAALLAPHVDGVVLALNPATDQRAVVEQSRARLLSQPGVQLLGAVICAPLRQKRTQSVSAVQLPHAGEHERVQSTPALLTAGTPDEPTEPAAANSVVTGGSNHPASKRTAQPATRRSRRRRQRAARRRVLQTADEAP